MSVPVSPGSGGWAEHRHCEEPAGRPLSRNIFYNLKFTRNENVTPSSKMSAALQTDKHTSVSAWLRNHRGNQIDQMRKTSDADKD